MAKSARDIKAGGAYVEIGARTEKFKRGMASVKKTLGNASRSVRIIGIKMAAFGGATTGLMAAAAKSFATFGDEIVKAGKRVGFTSETMSALAYAANLAGASMGAVEKGIRGMQRAMFDAERGSAEIVDALDKLGLSFRDLQGLNPEKQFMIVAARLGGIEDASLKSALAMKIFGRAGAELIPMLDGGSEALAKITEEARKLGVIMTKDMSRKAEELTDQFFRLKMSFQGIKNAIGSALFKPIMRLLNLFMGIAIKIKDLINDNPVLVAQFFKLAIAIAAVGAALLALPYALPGILLGAGIRIVLKKMGLLDTLLEKIGKRFPLIKEYAKTSMRWLGEAFEAVEKILTHAWNVVKVEFNKMLVNLYITFLKFLNDLIPSLASAIAKALPAAGGTTTIVKMLLEQFAKRFKMDLSWLEEMSGPALEWIGEAQKRATAGGAQEGVETLDDLFGELTGFLKRISADFGGSYGGVFKEAFEGLAKAPAARSGRSFAPPSPVGAFGYQATRQTTPGQDIQRAQLRELVQQNYSLRKIWQNMNTRGNFSTAAADGAAWYKSTDNAYGAGRFYSDSFGHVGKG